MNITSIIIILSIAVLLGITLFTFVWTEKKRPMPLVIAHGIFALVGFLTLHFYIADETADMAHAPVTSSYLFGFAALGGVAMFIIDKILGKPIPKWFPIIHGGLALVGYITLWSHALAK